METNRYLQNDQIKEETSSSGGWKSISATVSDSDESRSNGWDCSICLELAQDPVVTLCGHLYCWPCMYRWLNFQTTSNENPVREHKCPVCKAEVSRATLVPLYGGGGPTKVPVAKSHHPGLFIPRRPSGPLCGMRTLLTPPGDTASRRTARVHGRRYSNQSVDSSSAMENSHPFGAIMYARMFGNGSSDLYPYPNSYRLAGSDNPRVRRQLRQADKSLGRICFFLCCGVFLCLVFF